MGPEDVAALLFEPPPMVDGELRVVLAARVPGDPAQDWVPAYHFELYVERPVAGRVEGRIGPIGHVNLRIGDTKHVLMHAGHIGYSVDPAWRGRRFAARAAMMVIAFAHAIGRQTLWITCNPDNAASLRTLEILGAERVEEVAVPPGTEMYARGERRKVRFRLRRSRACDGSK